MCFRKKPKVSIITVCYHEGERIAYTLDSILRQTSTDYELLVCDGGSSDNTYDIVLSYKRKFKEKGIHFYSQSKKDGGIYQGMNCGIKAAKGEYLLFMNGGDGFNHPEVLEQVLRETALHPADVLYGNCELFDDHSRAVYVTDIAKIRFGECINHQSALIKSHWLKERPYRTDIRIVADYEYWLYLLEHKAVFHHLDMTIACFRLNGISGNSDFGSHEMDEVNRQYGHLAYLNSFPLEDHQTAYGYDLDQTVNNNLSFGWSNGASCGVWSVKEKSSFYFYLQQIKDLCLAIHIEASFADYRNQLYVNGHYVCDLMKVLGEHRIFIRKDWLIQGHNEFSLCCYDKLKKACEVDPAINDKRLLNLLVSKTAIYDDQESLSDDQTLCYGAFSGWSFAEGDYCWAIGRCTTFGHYLREVTDLALQFDVKIQLDYDNALYVNDVLVSNIEKTTGTHHYFIDRSLLHQGANVFAIRTENEVAALCQTHPDSPDPRRLNLFIGYLGFSPVESR